LIRGVKAGLRRDQELVALFLRGYNEKSGSDYRVRSWADEAERQKPAVEAVCEDTAGRLLAIEHTLVQPFWGEKEDTQPFRVVFVPLERDVSLRLPDYDIELWPSVGSIPKGINWAEVGERVKSWFRENRAVFPEGGSTHPVPGLSFQLDVYVQKTRQDDGFVFVGRSNMPDTLDRVLEKALADKLPKLVAASVNRRILLLEKDGPSRGYVEIGRLIEGYESRFPNLSNVDEIWIVNTVAWESEGALFYYKIWPGGVTLRFRVKV